MSAASLAAYDRILPDLPRRERQVQELLLSRLQANPSGPSGLTCRQIADRLGLGRDSVSPRIGALQNKGLVVAAGIYGTETLWEAYNDPENAKPLPKRKSRPYRKAIEDAAVAVDAYLLNRGHANPMGWIALRDDIRKIILDLAKV